MFKAGDLIADRYVIVDAPMAGGMASVFRARDQVSGRAVAVKVAFGDTSAKDALYRELHCLQALCPHDHIVSLLHSDLIDDMPVLVLERLESDLEGRIADYWEMPWRDLMREIGMPVLSALRHAHQRQFLHRDITPRNIMFDPTGKLKLIDFGIAQVPTSVGVGLTFRQHGTIPYIPENRDDFGAGAARDCYSFAVLMLSCIHGQMLTSYEQLRDVLQATDPAAYPISVFKECIEGYPSNCPQSAGTLRAKLLRWQDAYQPDMEVLRLALRALGPGPEGVGVEGATWGEVFEDWMSEPRVLVEEEPPRLRIAGQRFRATLAIQDARRGIYQVQGRVSTNRGGWSEGFIQIPLSIDLEGHSAGKPTPWYQVLDAYDQAQEKEAERQAQIERDRPFTSWENYLAAEQQALMKKPVTIRYRSLEQTSEREFSFEMDEGSARQNVTEEVTLIWREQKKKLISVMAIEENRVFARAKYPLRLPESGTLAVEYHALKQALVRKKRALLTVKDRLAVTPALRDYISEPETAPAPEPSGGIDGVDDVHQLRAIDSALGVQSWLMIEGPPGTGKSTVIAEIIRRYLHRYRSNRPRILLAAQTHIAIDSVLHKLLQEDALKELIVRIPSGNLDKVDPLVRPLLVEHRVQAFRELAIARSEAYLEREAAQLGADFTYIRLAILLGLLEQAESEARQLTDELETLARQTAELTNAEAGQEDAEDEDEARRQLTETVDLVTREDHLNKALQEVQDRLRRLRQQLIQVEPGFAGILKSNDGGKGIEEWRAALEPELRKAPRLAELVRLQLDWLHEITAGRALHQAVVRDAVIVAGTCVGMGTQIADQEFDLCIVDEASKAMPVEALIPMARARKWILVGDTRQLPPYIDQEIKLHDSDEQAWVEDSLLKSIPQRASHTGADLPWYLTLKNQRRMTRGICDLISKVFYENALEPKRSDDSRLPAIAAAYPKPVTWIDVRGVSRKDEVRKGSLFNDKEIQAVLVQLHRLEKAIGAGAPPDIVISVAVIAGYAAQARRLEAEIGAKQHQWRHLAIEIASIDRFQGNEKDVAIVSLVRGINEKGLGYLKEKERINVAFSRARDALIIVGSVDWVAREGTGSKLGEALEYVNRNHHACAITSPR